MKPQQLQIDFRKPNKRMLMRDGEEPVSAVIAYTPDCAEEVITAVEQILVTLDFHMDEDSIDFLETDRIKMTSGTEIELDEFSLYFSVAYPTAPGRTFEMQFGAPKSATLH